MTPCLCIKAHESGLCRHPVEKWRWRDSDGCQGSLCDECWFPWINEYGTCGPVNVILEMTRVNRWGIPVNPRDRSMIEMLCHATIRGGKE